METYNIIGEYSDGHREVLLEGVWGNRVGSILQWLNGVCDGSRYYAERV